MITRQAIKELSDVMKKHNVVIEIFHETEKVCLYINTEDEDEWIPLPTSISWYEISDIIKDTK